MSEQNIMNEQIKKMAKEICLATQKTNYSCKSMCKKQGNCAYCIVMAESLYNAGYHEQSENTVDLPCKVGDSVYKIYDPESVHRRILELVVFRIEIKETTNFFVKTVEKYPFNKDILDIEDFGKKVFLTKDKAEKALEKMKGGAE